MILHSQQCEGIMRQNRGCMRGGGCLHERGSRRRDQAHLGVGFHLDERDKVDERGHTDGHHSRADGQHEQEAGLVRLQEGNVEGSVDAGTQAQQGFQDANDCAPAFGCSASLCTESRHHAGAPDCGSHRADMAREARRTAYLSVSKLRTQVTREATSNHVWLLQAIMLMSSMTM